MFLMVLLCWMGCMLHSKYMGAYLHEIAVLRLRMYTKDAPISTNTDARDVNNLCQASSNIEYASSNCSLRNYARSNPCFRSPNRCNAHAPVPILDRVQGCPAQRWVRKAVNKESLNSSHLAWFPSHHFSNNNHSTVTNHPSPSWRGRTRGPYAPGQESPRAGRYTPQVISQLVLILKKEGVMDIDNEAS